MQRENIIQSDLVKGITRELIKEGRTGHEAFVLVSGEVRVFRERDEAPDATLATLGPGALVGEMALVTGSVRTASVSTTRPSVLLALSGAKVEALASRYPDLRSSLADYARRRLLENLLTLSPVLSVVPRGEHNPLLACFEPKTFEAGQFLVNESAMPDGIYVIALGRVQVSRADASGELQVAELTIGDVVGEIALVLRRPATATVTALVPTVTLFLPRHRFLEIVDRYPLVLRELYSLALQRIEENEAYLVRQAASGNDIILV